MKCFAEAGDARNACLQRANIGNAYMQLGAFSRAERVLRQAITVAQPMKLGFLAPVQANLGFALARLGHLERGARDRDRRRAALRPRGLPPLRGRVAHLPGGDPLACAASSRGAEARARARPRAGVDELAADPRARARHPRRPAPRARAAPPRRARAAAEEAMRILASLEGVEEGEALIRLAHILALEATGDDGEARRPHRRGAGAGSCARAERIGDPRYGGASSRTCRRTRAPSRSRRGTSRRGEGGWRPDRERRIAAPVQQGSARSGRRRLWSERQRLFSTERSMISTERSAIST